MKALFRWLRSFSFEAALERHQVQLIEESEQQGEEWVREALASGHTLRAVRAAALEASHYKTLNVYRIAFSRGALLEIARLTDNTPQGRMPNMSDNYSPLSRAEWRQLRRIVFYTALAGAVLGGLIAWGLA